MRPAVPIPSHLAQSRRAAPTVGDELLLSVMFHFTVQREVNTETRAGQMDEINENRLRARSLQARPDETAESW